MDLLGLGGTNGGLGSNYVGESSGASQLFEGKINYQKTMQNHPNQLTARGLQLNGWGMDQGRAVMMADQTAGGPPNKRLRTEEPPRVETVPGNPHLYFAMQPQRLQLPPVPAQNQPFVYYQHHQQQFTATPRFFSASNQTQFASNRTQPASTQIQSSSNQAQFASNRTQSASTQIQSSSNQTPFASNQIQSASTQIQSASTQTQSFVNGFAPLQVYSGGPNGTGDFGLNSGTRSVTTPVGNTGLAMPANYNKDWQSAFPYARRSHIIGRLVKAILPSTDGGVAFDGRTRNVVEFVRRLERNVFVAADCRPVYCRTLLTKIFLIQKELNEKRRQRMEWLARRQRMEALARQAQHSAQSTLPTPTAGSIVLVVNPQSLVRQQPLTIYQVPGPSPVPVQPLDYCCGQKYIFTPQKLICLGKERCYIARGVQYFSYENKYHYCLKCFSKITGDMVNVVHDLSAPPVPVRRDLFVKMKNDHIEPEPFVSCPDCGRSYHKICVLHMDEIWSEGFICDNCLKAKNETRKENKFTAKQLPATKLGTYVETCVNNFLRQKSPGSGKVHIRVLSSSERSMDVMPRMKKRFSETGSLSDSYPYTSKAIFAFQEIDNTEVCFFGMHVQEYGSDCPLPNRRRVYIAYLDSVHFFRPKQCRTAVYHQILLGYLQYAKLIGYTHAHIWASPPFEGDDYIFYCHPPEQKIPTTKRLKEWYGKMLDKAIVEGAILGYTDILKQAKEDRMSSVVELPYFEGDFWPNNLEQTIKELDEEQAKLARKTKTPGRPNANRRKGKKKPNAIQTDDPLLAKVSTTMEPLKDTFFVVQLHSARSAACLPPRIQDPDPISTCEIMDGREGFLAMARNKNCEFSSLRRAKHSTMVMLYDLHTQQFIYTCDNCNRPVEGIRYHCIECAEVDSYDNCVECYENAVHPHKMEKIGLD